MSWPGSPGCSFFGRTLPGDFLLGDARLGIGLFLVERMEAE
jgi:hypothetical protein